MAHQDFSAGPHTSALWDRVEPIVSETERLPFLRQLADGTLDARTFTHYIVQDGIYLSGYARAMSLLAARTDDRAESRFWAASAAETITEEEDLHASLLRDPRLAGHFEDLTAVGGDGPSPTTLGYVSYLLAGAATDSYGVGVAGVLPCFWVYAHIGAVLTRMAGELTAAHPYRAWIELYDSPAFAAATREAVGVLERRYAGAPAAERTRMAETFTRSCRYELHFWASAHARQGWDAAQFIPPAALHAESAR